MNCEMRDGMCLTHGNPGTGDYCLTVDVLDLVREERAREFAQYGTNNDLADGTGPGAQWLLGCRLDDRLTADELQESFRAEYEKTEARAGTITWMHLVREEVAEAFAESDLDRLEEELIQVAALCVSWVESITLRRRGARRVQVPADPAL